MATGPPASSTWWAKATCTDSTVYEATKDYIRGARTPPQRRQSSLEAAQAQKCVAAAGPLLMGELWVALCWGHLPAGQAVWQMRQPPGAPSSQKAELQCLAGAAATTFLKSMLPPAALMHAHEVRPTCSCTLHSPSCWQTSAGTGSNDWLLSPVLVGCLASTLA